MVRPTRQRSVLDLPAIRLPVPSAASTSPISASGSPSVCPILSSSQPLSRRPPSVAAGRSISVALDFPAKLSLVPAKSALAISAVSDGLVMSDGFPQLVVPVQAPAPAVVGGVPPAIAFPANSCASPASSAAVFPPVAQALSNLVSHPGSSIVGPVVCGGLAATAPPIGVAQSPLSSDQVSSSVSSLGTEDLLFSSVQGPSSCREHASALDLGGKRPSFAQALIGSPRTDFVKYHAAAVEGFGRVLDVQVLPRLDTMDGMPAVFFSPVDEAKAAAVFDQAVVLKFRSGRPSLEVCRASLSSEWGFTGKFSMGLLNSRSLLLRFELASDVVLALSREAKAIRSFPFSIARWNSRLSTGGEDSIAPVWVSFPKLPLHWAIASCVGKFLRMDLPTATLSKPSVARVCVEVDLRKPLPSKIWIGMQKGFWQEIAFEKLPLFCSICCLQGHSKDLCRHKFVPVPGADCVQKLVSASSTVVHAVDPPPILLDSSSGSAQDRLHIPPAAEPILEPGLGPSLSAAVNFSTKPVPCIQSLMLPSPAVQSVAFAPSVGKSLPMEPIAASVPLEPGIVPSKFVVGQSTPPGEVMQIGGVVQAMSCMPESDVHSFTPFKMKISGHSMIEPDDPSFSPIKKKKLRKKKGVLRAVGVVPHSNFSPLGRP